MRFFRAPASIQPVKPLKFILPFNFQPPHPHTWFPPHTTHLQHPTFVSRHSLGSWNNSSPSSLAFPCPSLAFSLPIPHILSTPPKIYSPPRPQNCHGAYHLLPAQPKPSAYWIVLSASVQCNRSMDHTHYSPLSHYRNQTHE